MANKMRDIAGQKFGMLTAIKYKERRGNSCYWEFLCDCGATTVKRRLEIEHFKSTEGMQSCGCRTTELKRIVRISHGMTGHSLHRTWLNIKYRCMTESSCHFDNYGGRGISVCDRWIESFDNFFEDMGGTWKNGLSLDRIDNNGNYEPGNCRWATPTQQTRNKRDNVIIQTMYGDMCIGEAAEMAGVSHSTIRGRVKRGWPIERLFDPQKRTWKCKVKYPDRPSAASRHPTPCS